LSNVLTDVGVHMKRMRFGKKSLNKIYSKFGLKAFVSCLLFTMVSKKGDAFTTLLLTLL